MLIQRPSVRKHTTIKEQRSIDVRNAVDMARSWNKQIEKDIAFRKKLRLALRQHADKIREFEKENGLTQIRYLHLVVADKGMICVEGIYRNGRTPTACFR